ncbi:kinase-like protein [Lojkania enalia]|uniref:Kinase-like protein n=1 Tax=Lojkania enalia TaxID=147567 RepID=A0A9P4KF12_9PLEO|nr:kinase-like protein [Didymosphaeria enalia]
MDQDVKNSRGKEIQPAAPRHLQPNDATSSAWPDIQDDMVPSTPNLKIQRPEGVEADTWQTNTPSKSGASSFIQQDSGDSYQLADNAGPDRFRNQSDVYLPIYDQAGEADDAEEDEGSAISPQSRITTQVNDPHRDQGIQSSPSSLLGEELRSAKLESLERNGCYFIPMNGLDRILTRNSVHDELNRLNIGPRDERLEIADRVWKIPSNVNKTTRRKIFAILVLLEKVDMIVHFIAEHIHDSDLPFTFCKDGKGLCYGSNRPISLFRTWKAHEKDNFETYQWWMLSPYFQFSHDKQLEVRRMVVQERVVLPFVAEKSESEQPPWNYGGFSIVRKVKFHVAHYNSRDFSATEESNPFFAIKTLKLRPDENHLETKEVKSLMRLNLEKDNHLIRLLAVFQHKQQLHLVFPWADGNLHEFWTKFYSQLTDPRRDAHLAKWMITQLLGLVLGLQKIHHSPVREKQAQTHGLSPDAPQKKYGRHGDLKPENILWFRPNHSNSGTDYMGVLRISDFGFADFHGSKSKSKVSTEGLGVTDTYRPPEFDVSQKLSSQYDIWCIGCVLLEFVVWYLCGSKGIDDFIQRRLDDSINEIPHYREDNFFNLIKSDLYERKAQAKVSVHEEIHTLRHVEDSSDLVLDILDYIEDHLLRIDPKNRHSCGALVEKIQAIYSRCHSDEDYCTKRTQKIREAKETGLSELCQTLQPKHSAATSSTPQSSASIPTETYHEIDDTRRSKGPSSLHKTLKSATKLPPQIAASQYADPSISGDLLNLRGASTAHSEGTDERTLEYVKPCLWNTETDIVGRDGLEQVNMSRALGGLKDYKGKNDWFKIAMFVSPDGQYYQ